MEPRLLTKRPESRFFEPGWTYLTPENTFIVIEGRNPDKFEGIVDKTNHRIVLMFPPGAGPDAKPRLTEWVNKVLDKYARFHAAGILIPMAEELAQRLGVKPADLGISYGQRVLGRCNCRGEILLSRNLVFYPSELREFVIAHEFAHLTHLDHSPEFYSLLDCYLGGRHKELNFAFKSFKLPFIK